MVSHGNNRKHTKHNIRSHTVRETNVCNAFHSYQTVCTADAEATRPDCIPSNKIRFCPYAILYTHYSRARTSNWSYEGIFMHQEAICSDTHDSSPSFVGLRLITLHPVPSPLTSVWTDGLLVKVLVEDPPSDLILPLDCPMLGPSRLSHEEIRGRKDFPKHVRQPSCSEGYTKNYGITRCIRWPIRFVLTRPLPQKSLPHAI